MEGDIDRGDDITDNKENSLEGPVVGESLLKERFLKKPIGDRKVADGSGGTSPLPPLPPKTPSQGQAPPQPFGGHVRHNENDAVVSNGVGLLRRPSTPSRKRNSVASHIPKPVGSTRQPASRLVGPILVRLFFGFIHSIDLEVQMNFVGYFVFPIFLFCLQIICLK